jgi:hypothetical protein
MSLQLYPLIGIRVRRAILANGGLQLSIKDNSFQNLAPHSGVSSAIVTQRSAPAARPPNVPSSQTQAGMPTRARPAVEQ